MKELKMNHGQKISSSERKAFIKAIDNLFLKLELSYHYQFYKVFGTDKRLKEAKRLWAESLKRYSPTCIYSATETVVKTNDYLPTLTEVIKACGESIDVLNIPSTQEAFIEAQKSSAPRKEYNWTTPIIYWAAREVGWDIINSSNNPNAFKLFSKVYARLANKMNEGQSFDISIEEPNEEVKPLDKELLRNLRKKHNL